ncbi:MAG: SDR family NAD(P)-dependent oxidoreductase [Proteobacteria bacterium]|nr:SDR family NAD(P)-dependent oxidoreductase [Pseudomonadota bacterium]
MDKAMTVTFRLEGRRALVTGSASGIGLATAERLARSGAHVAMNDLAGPALDAAVARLRADGLKVDPVAGDLSQSATAADVARRAVELLGGLDYLVNNAGAPCTRTPIPPADIDALTDDFWDRILRINLMSAFWMTRALAPQLRAARGAIVNTVSVAALGGGASSGAYATAKAGLAGLTREMARGLAPEVRVNGIAPGYVNSNWECSFGDIHEAARASVPLARVGEPSEYAEVILFLCAGASYMTGEVVPVTGGSRL